MRRVGDTGRSRRRRGGFLSMELVLALPVFLIVLLAMVEFSMLFFARGDVVSACRTGARAACVPGATEADVEARVRQVLDDYLESGLRVRTDRGERSGDVVQVSVHVPMQAAAPDLLWPIGFGLRDRWLSARVRMVRE